MKRIRARTIEAAVLALLAERGTASATPAGVARILGEPALLDQVREVAAKLQDRGHLDAYQRGRPVKIRTTAGAIHLRARDVKTIDYRAQPERYVIGRGEQGVLTVEPYKSELSPLWKFRTPALARTSARALYAAFVAYGRANDFVGMDMARKFLQMGWTRARRYANHKSGTKYTTSGQVRPRAPDAVKAEAAEVFRIAYDRARANRTYKRLRAAFEQA